MFNLYSFVYKALPLRTTTGKAQYWIEPSGPDHWQRVIREDIMPTLAEWTSTEWHEFQGPEEPGEYVLRWHSQSTTYSPWCADRFTAGCAQLGMGEIALYPYIGSGLSVPDEMKAIQTTFFNRRTRFTDSMLYKTGLHEAVHALYAASHSLQGLVCGLGCELRTLDEEVYTLYGNPLLTHGMSKEQVKQIVQVPAQ